MASMAEIGSTAWVQRRKDTTSWLGMIFFLAAWAMMFGALFATYGAVRARAGMWPPMGLPSLPLLLPGINTAVLALSSAALHGGMVALRRDRRQWAGPAFGAAACLGVLFLVLQMMVWTELYAVGLRQDSGIYGSAFYMLTVFHALHVIVGLVALGVIATQALRGVYTAQRHLAPRLWALYWHFVAVVWALMFATVYLY